MLMLTIDEKRQKIAWRRNCLWRVKKMKIRNMKSLFKVIVVMDLLWMIG